jgi:hypothetical protein
MSPLVQTTPRPRPPDSPRGIPTLFVLILFMGGIIDKHITEKGTRYRAIWTDRARE